MLCTVWKINSNYYTLQFDHGSLLGQHWPQSEHVQDFFDQYIISLHVKNAAYKFCCRKTDQTGAEILLPARKSILYVQVFFNHDKNKENLWRTQISLVLKYFGLLGTLKSRKEPFFSSLCGVKGRQMTCIIEMKSGEQKSWVIHKTFICQDFKHPRYAIIIL